MNSIDIPLNIGGRMRIYIFDGSAFKGTRMSNTPTVPIRTLLKALWELLKEDFGRVFKR